MRKDLVALELIRTQEAAQHCFRLSLRELATDNVHGNRFQPTRCFDYYGVQLTFYIRFLPKFYQT